MRILRSADYHRMPWKNGGGETRQIAVSPPDASLDALDWRISLATVASDGPFSTFGGITRTLCVIQGSGIELRVGDAPARKLTVSSEPCTFDGETPTSAALIDGPIVDLNVMTRRGRFRHHVSRQFLSSGSCELAAVADTTLIFCRDGALLCSNGSQSSELGREDCAIVEQCSHAMRLSAAPRAEILVIALYRELTRSAS